MAASVRFLIFALASLMLIPGFASSKDVKPFFHAQTARDAARYESFLRRNWTPNKKSSDSWRQEGDQSLNKGDARTAAGLYAAAVVSNSNDADAWSGLARALLLTKPANSRERYDLPANASGAALIAYQRAKSDKQKAAALGILGEALARRSFWRPSITAYKTSLALNDNAAIRATLTKLRAQYGFRITDYSVNSDAASPRLCVQFSETIDRTVADYAKFFSVNGKDPVGVRAENRQICLEGFQHGERYEVAVRSGLPSSVDEPLQKSAQLRIYVKDRSPSVRFTGRNYVLPTKGQQGIPVISVNASALKLKVYRIGDRGLVEAVTRGQFQQQLSNWSEREIANKARKVWNGTLDVKTELNENVATAFPVTETLGKLEPGVYIMTARPSMTKGEQYGDVATQWFIVSDLGLTTFSAEDGIHAVVRSLETAKPVAGAVVKLLAKSNEVLGSSRTNKSGYLKFDAGLSRGTDGSAPALIVAETQNGDYAFLNLTAPAFDLTDRGDAGRASSKGGVEGFIFTERGVYRAGEQVHLTGMLREASARAAPMSATTAVFTRPDGVEYRRTVLQDDGLGGRTYSLQLGKSVMTGTWQVALHTDPKAPPVATTSFLVEDFVPERLSLELKPDATEFTANRDLTINVLGKYLYGPPASKLALDGDIIIRPRKNGLVKYPGFSFGLADQKPVPTRQKLEALGATNEQGTAAPKVRLPVLPSTTRLLNATVLMRMIEPGGRSIERRITLPIKPQRAIIGLKPTFADNVAKENSDADVRVVALDATGAPQAGKKLTYELFKIRQSFQWYSQNGSWRYQPVSYTNRIATNTFTVGGDGTATLSLPVEYGRYRLEVSSPGEQDVISSIVFTAGWYTGADANTPEKLDLALDKSAYRPGENANMTITSEHPGEALIAVMDKGIRLTRNVTVKRGRTDVQIPVGDWGAGAYVSATLFRPMDRKAKRMPARSLGITWLKIDPEERTLKLALDTPEKIKSGTRLRVPVKIENHTPGETVHMTVSAVDVGILNLTRYKTPKPLDHYFAQRRLGAAYRDLYGRLIDGMSAQRGSIRSGGDGGNSLEMSGNPTTDVTVAEFSGLVKLNSDGTANVDFDLPAFNGTVRITAVAWSTNRMGSTTSDVIVRDPVAMLVSKPRFMHLGDTAKIAVDLHNLEAPSGVFQIGLTSSADTSLKLSQSVTLAKDDRSLERLELKATRLGKTQYNLTVQGPGGLELKRQFTLDVAPPAQNIRRRSTQTLAANTGRLNLSADLIADLIPETARVSVSVGPFAGIDMPGLFTSLQSYPYGCAEQTTSRAMPLLYLSKLDAAKTFAQRFKVRERIQKALTRLANLQGPSGAFGLWNAGGGDLWLTAYVSDFMSRAKEQGYEVDGRIFGQALDRLQNFVSFSNDVENGGASLAYAIYVLSRNGRTPIGDLRYFADAKLESFETPMAQAMIGAALGMYGDKERAATVFASAIDLLGKKADTETYRADFGTRLRDSAAVLTLVSESNLPGARRTELAELLSRLRSRSDLTSTQEKAWLLLAAQAMADDAKRLKLEVAGQTTTGALMRTYSAAQLIAAPIPIRNMSADQTRATITVTGDSLTPEPALSQGFTVERTFYTLAGKEADLQKLSAGNALRQNDRFVVVLNIASKGNKRGRVLLEDRLPAGFTIENPRLVDSGSISSLSWLKSAIQPVHSEFRDDRFAAAFNMTSSDKTTATVAYIVRATTPGTFVHPAASVEDMYRPSRFARTSSGKITVQAR